MQTEVVKNAEELDVKQGAGIAHRKIKWKQVSWTVVLACMTVITLVPSTYIPMTWLMLPFVCIMFVYDDFYTLCGIFLFFEDNIVLIPGLSLFAIYSLMVVVKYFLFDKCEKRITVAVIPAILIMVMYAVFAMPTADTTAARLTYVNSGRVPPSDAMINMRLIIGYALDSAAIILLAMRIGNDNGLKRKLCIVIVITAVMSGVFGYTAGRIFVYGGEDAGINRYMASFNDPNYASFFFNLAIFTVLATDIFKKLYLKIPLLLIFYYFLVATGSLSGLIFNVIGIAIFTIFKYRLKAVLALSVTAVIFTGVWLAITKIPQVASLEVIVNMQTRITRQFAQKEETSVSDATSGRETQWKNYWEYFKKQEPEKKLFGGNIITSSSIDQSLKEEFGNAPHQAYLSFILNFGIIGGGIMILFFLIKLVGAFIIMCKSNDGINLLMFIIACMWLFYGMGFDYFGDWRFMIFYFL